MDPPMVVPPYDMNHRSRGPVLIFNNKNFPGASDLKRRDFNDIDTANMMKCLKTLGYTDIRQKRDLTAEQMMGEIRNIASMDHVDHDSVVVVFLSYGEHNLVHAKDRPIGMQILIDPLKGDACDPSLIGKPKIIIAQTCNPPSMLYENDGEDDGQKVKRQVIPAEADFVYLGSEVPGLITGRKFTHGSLFISHLSRRLQTDGRNLELRRLATRTLHDVTEEMENWNEEWAVKNDERMPYFVSMLTRDLYFPEKKF